MASHCSRARAATNLIVLACILCAARALSSDCDLKSRGFAGFVYRDISQGDLDTLGLADSCGLVVSQVLAGSPAEHAGLRTGDILKGFAGHEVMDGAALVGVMRLFYAGDSVELDLLSDGGPVKRTVVLAEPSREAGKGIETDYTCFESDGVRLRAVVTSPQDRSGERLPALLMVSALASPRLIAMPAYSAGREIAHAVTRSGVRVLRFELRGSGDSEGEDYRATDFDAEVADNLAALDYLISRKDVDTTKVFVMGHSTGGMVAAVIGSRRRTAGIITSCTIGRTFYERSLETLRLQSALGGDSPAVTDSRLKLYLDLMTSAARGDSLPAIILRNPEVAQLVNRDGRIMDDRNLDYWREQLSLSLPEVYSQITEPVLIVYAASDFLTQQACHDEIRDVLLASGNSDVTLEIVPRTDHAYALAADKSESYENCKTRDFKGNPEPIKRIVAWLAEHTR